MSRLGSYNAFNGARGWLVDSISASSHNVTTSHSISWTDVSREAADHLGHLLALDTSVPPVWEFPAARYLLGLFEREGIPALLLPPTPSGGLPPALSPVRPNLVAHLPGSGVDEPLLLLSHLDSAPPAKPEWEPIAPSGGQTLRGPGALAGTHLAVAQAMALILLGRSGVPLRRTVRYAATSEGSGGKGIGLHTLARDHLEHITSDIALGWGGVSWIGADGAPCSLLATGEKGALWLKLRSEGGGGSFGVKPEKDPVEKLVKVLGRLSKIDFPPRPSDASRALVQSVGAMLPEGKAQVLQGLNDPRTASRTLSALEQGGDIAPGLTALLRASLRTEWAVVRLDASAADGLRPRVAEAELVYCFPPGEDVEALARRVLDALGPDGVYLAEKAEQQPSESALTPEVAALARAALEDVDPRARLVVGLAPWPSGLGSLRRYGTGVFGWEPFASAGSLAETLSRRGGPGEVLEEGDFIQEIRALYSFLSRAVG